ncbi:efflux transporter outer membrane subunit [Solilutibacter silvestris]|uniref:efflux transporter outer membrane subunit n=1 Tax=Solilutibacter silvestris TaxID=1645665 RepID=UPI003D3584E2
MMSLRPLRSALAAALVVAAAGCSLVPTYQRPALQIPAEFKEAPAGWHAVAPADEQSRGEWWRGFNDPVLDGLEADATAHNQTVAAAVAAYDGERALLRESRAGLWPDISGSVGVSKSGGSASTSSGRRANATVSGAWTIDLFGGLRAAVAQNNASMLASRASIGNALLAIHAQLASDYLQLRGMDAQLAAYQRTIAGYQRALTITQNRYKVGVAAHMDVLQAETTLRNAQSQATDMQRQRATLEHAVAVLSGRAPADLTLVAQQWNDRVPAVPAALPSDLLQRRPDVAAAERSVMAANASIGVQRAALFPSLSLSASSGRSAQVLGDLASGGSAIWSLGLTGAMTLLDWGARSARVDQARASYEQSAANYRQTVLSALQQTEDALVDLRSYADEAANLKASSEAADKVEQMTLNQYLAGMADYTTVVTAQNTALAARRSAIAAVVQQQQAAVTLTQAIGGGWDDTVPAR